MIDCGAIAQTGSPRTYSVHEGSIPVALPGAADDYAFSRHRADNTKKKILAYTLESGDSATKFRPVFDTTFSPIQREIHAAILATKRGWI